MSEMDESEAETRGEQEIFGISAVSRLTGISTHVLRIWERRYCAVDPARTDSKRRQYTREHIRRLTLLKTLTESGHSIGNLAKLTTEALEHRLHEAQAAGDSRLATAPEHGKLLSCRVGFVGALARNALREAADATPALQLVGEFDDLEALTTSLRPGAVDLLVIETPTFFEHQIEGIQRALKDIGARRAIVVYRFAQSDAVAPLHRDIPAIAAMLAPVDAAELKLACLADVRTEAPPAPAFSEGGPSEFSSPAAAIPPRRFSDRDLARIAGVSSVVKCECPQHLASLLSGLSAFEAYSAECENLNTEDARLHAFLHRTTAQCRATMEDTLQTVLEAEGIDISGGQTATAAE